MGILKTTLICTIGLGVVASISQQSALRRSKPAQSPVAVTQPVAANRDWKCPNSIQLKITGIDNKPVCVYRMGSNGQKIRADHHQEYHATRIALEQQNIEPAKIEQVLFEMDQIKMQDMIMEANK